MEEKEIIKRCQSGDRTAFDELIRLYYPYVTKYLLKLTCDEALTEDLTQDVFLKIIQSIDRFKINGRASFTTYIITVAKNTFIDYKRRNKAVVSELNDEGIQSGEDIENRVITNMQYSEVLSRLDSLPPEQASVIRLKYIDAYTLKEIEAIVGVPAKTVKSRIHEGTKKLRSILRLNKEE